MLLTQPGRSSIQPMLETPAAPCMQPAGQEGIRWFFVPEAELLGRQQQQTHRADWVRVCVPPLDGPVKTLDQPPGSSLGRGWQ